MNTLTPPTATLNLDTLFEELERLDLFAFMQRTWLNSSPIADGDKIVWKCQLPSPDSINTWGDTLQEAITQALTQYKEIHSLPQSMSGTAATKPTSLDLLIEGLTKHRGYIYIHRRWLNYNRKPEGNKIIWGCGLAAPEAFGAQGDTPAEAVVNAIARHDEICSVKTAA